MHAPLGAGGVIMSTDARIDYLDSVLKATTRRINDISNGSSLSAAQSRNPLPPPPPPPPPPPLSSAENEEDMGVGDNDDLSNVQTIRGKLHLQSVVSIPQRYRLPSDEEKNSVCKERRVAIFCESTAGQGIGEFRRGVIVDIVEEMDDDGDEEEGARRRMAEIRFDEYLGLADAKIDLAGTTAWLIKALPNEKDCKSDSTAAALTELSLLVLPIFPLDGLRRVIIGDRKVGMEQLHFDVFHVAKGAMAQTAAAIMTLMVTSGGVDGSPQKLLDLQKAQWLSRNRTTGGPRKSPTPATLTTKKLAKDLEVIVGGEGKALNNVMLEQEANKITVGASRRAS